MNIGFAGIFPFRPHQAHEQYLRILCEEFGARTFALKCSGSLLPCYNKAFKGKGLTECLKCNLGGVSSFVPGNRIYRIGRSHGRLEKTARVNRALIGSCGLLARAESKEEVRSAEFQRLCDLHWPLFEKAYLGASRWIETRNLDALVIFNGRQDLTGAVLMAAQDAGIPSVTHERTWFGPGLHITPGESSLSLGAITDLVQKYDERPLCGSQAVISASLIASRFAQKNRFEWRLYNADPTASEWPEQSKDSTLKILILPSSRSEFLGSNDWRTPWPDNFSALDLLMDRLRRRRVSVVLRCHPVWTQKIGSRAGENIENAYRNWANDHAVTCIGSASTTSTYDLIKAADIVVLNGGSSAVEAGFLGKTVVCLGPSTYMGSTFCRNLTTYEMLEEWEPEIISSTVAKDVIIRTLRFVYTRYARHPQFVEYVRPVSTVDYKFYAGADPDQIVQTLVTGKLTAWDSIYAQESHEENAVSEQVMTGEWPWDLDESMAIDALGAQLEFKSRFPNSLAKRIRPLFARGDTS